MIWLALFLWSETRSESFFLLVDGRVLATDDFFLILVFFYAIMSRNINGSNEYL